MTHIRTAIALATLLVAACTSSEEPGAPDAGASNQVDAAPVSTHDAGDNAQPDAGASTGVDAATQPGADAAPSADLACSEPNAPCTHATEDGSVTYTTAQGTTREVLYRIWYPESFTGNAPVIIVSHGGSGSTQGHTRFQHLGMEFASRGFVSIHLNHRASDNGVLHRFDRPADVSAVLDALVSGALAMPAGFAGTADVSRIGHVGHSWGAYTGHAVGGASFAKPDELGGGNVSFRDDRVKAIVPLSPQGWDGFGAYDAVHDITESSSDNSWSVVSIPAYNIIGGDEMNTRSGQFVGDKWRLFPFARYPADGTKYVSVLPGQNHGDIGNDGSPEVKTFIATNARLFLEVYLRGRPEVAGAIGTQAPLANTVNQHK